MPDNMVDTQAAEVSEEPTSEDYAAVEREMSDGTDQPEGEAETSGDETSDVTKARRDAAKYRSRLRETEGEREQLRDQLATQRRAVVEWRAANTHGGVDSALLDAAGIDVDTLLGENGALDMSLVDKFIEDTAARFRVAPGFKINRAQGQAGNGGDVKPKTSLADVFRQ